MLILSLIYEFLAGAFISLSSSPIRDIILLLISLSYFLLVFSYFRRIIVIVISWCITFISFFLTISNFLSLPGVLLLFDALLFKFYGIILFFSYNRLLCKIKWKLIDYFYENIHAVILLPFFILLITCLVFVLLRIEYIAECLASYAYFYLVFTLIAIVIMKAKYKSPKVISRCEG